MGNYQYEKPMENWSDKLAKNAPLHKIVKEYMSFAGDTLDSAGKCKLKDSIDWLNSARTDVESFFDLAEHQISEAKKEYQISGKYKVEGVVSEVDIKFLEQMMHNIGESNDFLVNDIINSLTTQCCCKLK